MAEALWRQTLQPASFNGVPFHVETQGKASGRRMVVFEYPKKDVPSTEDMGRRIRRFNLLAYIIFSPVLTPDYEGNRDALIAQLETEGPGMLVLPTGLENMIGGTSGMVVVDHYSVTEHREKGGWCEFEIAFIEAGQPSTGFTAVDTQSTANAQATSAAQAVQNSSDITSPA